MTAWLGRCIGLRAASSDAGAAVRELAGALMPHSPPGQTCFPVRLASGLLASAITGTRPTCDTRPGPSTDVPPSQAMQQSHLMGALSTRLRSKAR